MDMEKEVNAMNCSPLRYPGGKSRLAPFISLLIQKTGIENPIYVEPFAGGAGVALSLLLNSIVDEIVINDYDKAIYSVWRALLTETDSFIKLIEDTPLNIDEWKAQKRVYNEERTRYSLELGFAAFYLNRTNRSGILSNAGPIGGFNQTGDYLIDARFNRQELVRRVSEIAKHKSKIHLYNKDIRVFLEKYIHKYKDRAFIYFDPPYYNKGKALYKNFFSPVDHQEIYECINELSCPWLVTYDDVPEIRNIYSSYVGKRYDLIYSLANNGKKSELMFLSDDALWPSETELREQQISINLRGGNNDE